MTSDEAKLPDEPDSAAAATREPFLLSPEQQDTGALLERLLGTAMAERYVDLLKLTAEVTGLNVTIPLAGHALREMESTIRLTLGASMDAEGEQEEDAAQAEKVAEALRPLGYSQDDIDRAVKSLKPKVSHAAQIRKIAEHLGLAPDGDIANAWVTLSRTADQAHKRDFHHSLRIDADFRKEFQEPFELVVRGVMVALEPRFSAMTKRAEALAAMEPVSRAVKLFEKEIPGSLPLQWHFYQVLTSPRWLPFLIERNLTLAPVHETALGMRFRQWPIGFYLLRMAKLDDGSTPEFVVKALRTVASSKHRDVRQQGFDIAAALPPAEATSVSDIVVGWLSPDIRNALLDAPLKTVKSLAAARKFKPAFDIARAVFQLIDEDGSIATLHSQHMYEHYLPETVQVLAAADYMASIELFADLLMRGISISRRYLPDAKEDYTNNTPHPIAGNEMRTYEPYDALILAVRDSMLSALQQAPDQTDAVVSTVYSRGPKIFKRIALHALSKHSASAPALCKSLLTDTSLIGESWCEDEYAELALAWFPSLAATDQRAILAHIDRMPDEYRASWELRFEEHEKRPPDAKNVRAYEGSIFRDAVWNWRDVLPAERKQQLEVITGELGGPDAWKEQLFPTEVSPLLGTDFASRAIPEIVSFLQKWQPKARPKKQTITALAQQLRQAVDQESVRFAEQAERFAVLRPIYVRRVLEGLEGVVRNTRQLPWGSLLTLMEAVIAHAEDEGAERAVTEGDDPNWLWACATAASILRVTLGQGREGIPYEFAGRVLSLIRALLRIAPAAPESTDFENQFERHTYFSAEQTLRGRVTELCILYLFWESKQDGSPLNQNPNAAMAVREQIRTELNRQLNDRSANGRIPRAIIGRWMQWLNYFGKDWLSEHLKDIFPDEDDGLRLAAWRAHILNDSGPVKLLMPSLIHLYKEEVSRMARERESQDPQAARDTEHRDNRFGEYVFILYLGGDAPSELMQAFWRDAPERARQHVIWFLGSHLQLPADKLADHIRARGFAYWTTRLAAGVAATDKEPFCTELGAIASWCRHDNIPADWLLDQILKMLAAGYAPSSGYTVVEWLAKISADEAVNTIEALGLLLRNPHTEHWTYTTHKESIRTILVAALNSGISEASAKAEATIGYLASIGESEYLNLTRPTNETIH